MPWDPNVEDADRWVTCDQNHVHWGSAGAAGLLLHHNGRYLLQQRSPWVDHGMTWAPPSGALRTNEHPINGAVREAQEEMGEFPFSDPKVIHTADHGGWAFHTVSAEAPHQFEPNVDDSEVEDHGWFTPHEIDELPLHPGFRQSWSDIYTPPSRQTFSTTIPSMNDLSPHRWDQECYEVAQGIANKWPHLRLDAGYYVHPTKGAGDHGWNVAPDGTIVDMTAAQHDYNGTEDEPMDDGPIPVPVHPEIIPPGHPYYDRYVSWTGHPDASQQIAHQRGEHYGGPEENPACPTCNPRTSAWNAETPATEDGGFAMSNIDAWHFDKLSRSFSLHFPIRV